MKFEDVLKAHDEMERFIKNDLPVFASKVLASDIIALVIKRVVERGVNYKGAPFKPYSTKTIPAWRFWGKSRTQAAEAKIRKLAKSKSALSYKKFRELNNLLTNKKIFEFTGTMWRGFKVIRTTKSDTKFTITAGGINKAVAKKIEENSKREGVSIIEASHNENEIAKEIAEKWAEKKIKEILQIKI